MTLRVLHYSDVETAYDDPDRIGRLAGLIEARRDAMTLVVGTGDDLGLGALALATDGRAAREFFAAASPDADVFGNHDFDYGPETLLAVVRESSQAWLCANAYRDGERFGAAAGVRPWTVIEVGGAAESTAGETGGESLAGENPADRRRVGLFGVAHPDTPEIAPGADGIEFTDPVEAAREAVTALDDRGVDHVVGLSHLGDDAPLARATDADAVLGGHVHEARTERIAGTLVVRSSGLGGELVEVDLDAGTVQRHPIPDSVADDHPTDERVAEAYRARHRETGLDEVLARVHEPIHRDRDTLDGECRAGNFVADGFRWAARRATREEQSGGDASLEGPPIVGLMNSGGIRDGPALAGEVTVADVRTLLPFEEPVVIAAVSGADLLDVLAEGDGARSRRLPDRWHAHLSGVRVEYDPVRGAVADATVGDEPVDPDATYRLATSAYLLYTDHEFPTLGESHRERTLDLQYAVLADYARTAGIDPAIEGRVYRRPTGE